MNKIVTHTGDDDVGSDVRIVDSFPVNAKVALSVVWKIVCPSVGLAPPKYVCEAIAHRRREQAIIVQNLLGFKLRMLTMSSSLELFDVVNAFPSVNHAVLVPLLHACQLF